MNPVWEQEALDALVKARQALHRAEHAYMRAKGMRAKGISLDDQDGLGFVVVDNLDTAMKEIGVFCSVAQTSVG